MYPDALNKPAVLIHTGLKIGIIKNKERKAFFIKVFKNVLFLMYPLFAFTDYILRVICLF